MPEVKVDNLEAEMKRNKISRSDIANLLGLSYRTIHSRFNGESEWGYAECVKVRDAYFPNMTLDYASKERARAKMREIQEEHRKFITETRQKKNMKKPGRKSKQHKNELIRIAVEAREHGMSYGRYVGIYEYQKGMKI